MTYPDHLPRAPITEAVIDFRVQLPKEIDFGALESRANAAFGYEQKGALVENTFMLALNQAGVDLSSDKQSQKLGIRFESADAKYVATVRLGGFSLSRLAPYQDWQSLRAEAKRLWTIYVQQFSPLKVERVATRFINNLKLPMAHGEDFAAYLNSYAQVPDLLPQSVRSFANRYVLQVPDSTYQVNMSVVWRGTLEGDGSVPIVLDIDAYSTSDHDPNSDEHWKTLDSLRVLKNRCFFGSLTPRAWELYK